MTLLMLGPMNRLVWVELDSAAAGHNLRELRKCTADGVKLCAVIKSNAYGHGMSQMIELLDGADWFAVNSLEEGLELRSLGVTRPVLVVGYIPLSGLASAVDAGLSLTVFNRATIEELGRVGGEDPARAGAKVHVKVETGTGRQGVMMGELESFVDLVRSFDSIEFEGMSTHFANIEDTLNHSYAEMQLESFHKAIDLVCSRGPRPPIIHSACSAASILFPETHFDMLRTGVSVYGLWPSRETYLSALSGGGHVPDLRPVLTWKTRVVQLKILPPGSCIGYGCTYKTSRETTVAVLPIGYADGYDRALGNRAHVLVHGRRAPVLGRICMNVIMVDVSDIPGVELEDEVVLLGQDGEESIPAEMMAEWAGTINYEVVTRISPFLDRKTVRGDAT